MGADLSCGPASRCRRTMLETIWLPSGQGGRIEASVARGPHRNWDYLSASAPYSSNEPETSLYALGTSFASCRRWRYQRAVTLLEPTRTVPGCPSAGSNGAATTDVLSGLTLAGGAGCAVAGPQSIGGAL